MEAIKQCLQKCCLKGKRKEKSDDGTSRSVGDTDWEDGDWDDMESGSAVVTDSNRASASNSPLLAPGRNTSTVSSRSYSPTIGVAARKSTQRSRAIGWMQKKTQGNRTESERTQKPIVLSNQKGEDLFKDFGMDRQKISNQQKLRVHKPAASSTNIKNVSSRFQDNVNDDLGEEVGGAWEDG